MNVYKVDSQLHNRLLSSATFFQYNKLPIIRVGTASILNEKLNQLIQVGDVKMDTIGLDVNEQTGDSVYSLKYTVAYQLYMLVYSFSSSRILEIIRIKCASTPCPISSLSFIYNGKYLFIRSFDSVNRNSLSRLVINNQVLTKDTIILYNVLNTNVISHVSLQFENSCVFILGNMSDAIEFNSNDDSNPTHVSIAKQFLEFDWVYSMSAEVMSGIFKKKAVLYYAYLDVKGILKSKKVLKIDEEDKVITDQYRIYRIVKNKNDEYVCNTFLI